MGRNNYFRFKQFTIVHEKSGMKVGTDGVLIGAWSDHPAPQRVLDIGSGSGLTPLMLAQRYPVEITGVEIDPIAAAEAESNIAQSPWKERISIVHTSIQEYKSSHSFDLIVSNPPFFQNGPTSPDPLRKRARHTDSLSFEDLMKSVATLLSENGFFCVILPANQIDYIINIGLHNKLYLNKVCYVRPKQDSAPKRVMLRFCLHEKTRIIEESLFIEKDRHLYSDDYISLTEEFYLKM
ncbi:tRNA1(Val) (adenine(37)-N6)-methyltransferase [Halosquirtibacter xylanolyticus]|uniref:tRNA1(Val) (adenine(37)-N6)-methyltransferase n=1 Tax=Halosquirtibacter xylanolyticus TaxID=3374599 RepID=UPI00374A13DD|nr:tRNA1(Val) (adenine(37)-N6)-methyltransferase [Prolixibacteraceae bacterium]